MTTTDRPASDVQGVMEVIPIGDPGCYATPGHVDLAAFTAAAQREFGEWPLDYWEEDHGPARHTWMIVRCDEDEAECWFREVVASAEGAEPYTLIPCIGYWADLRNDTTREE